MFERFSGEARQVIVRAQDESRRLSHNYIGTEHLLLALLAQPDGVAKRALDAVGVTLDDARARVEAVVGRGKRTPNGHIPFTPRAKKVLELSLREAVQLRSDYISTEHLLLGLIREGDGLGAKVLTQTGLDLLALRMKVLDLIPQGSSTESRRRLFWPRARFGVETTTTSDEIRTTTATDATLDEARRLAGEAAVGSHHLLLATLNDPHSAAAKALGTLGVNLEQARSALRGVDVVGTTDELPEEAGRRQLAMHLRGSTLALETTDPTLVASAIKALNAMGASDGTITGDDPRSRAFADLWRAWHDSLEVIADTASAAPGPAAPAGESG